MRITTTNPKSKAPTQKQGPRTGNTGTPVKRSDFVAAKSSTGSERSALATMVTDAVANRGRLMKGYRDPAVESLKDTVNVGRKGSNRGNRA